MKVNHKLSHRLLAAILLGLHLFLQGCSNSTSPINSCSAHVEKSRGTILGSSQQILINELSNQKFTISGGYVVAFHENNGELQADVWLDEEQKTANYRNLPVTIEAGVDLKKLTYQHRKIQERRIEVGCLQNGQPRRIVILQSGLLGGMKRKRGDMEKEKDQIEQEEEEKLEAELEYPVTPHKIAGLNQQSPIIGQQEIKIHYDKPLGRGGYGLVFQANYLGQRVAAKLLTYASSEEGIAAFQKEARIMDNMRHENIVAFLGFYPREHAFVMEYVPGGSLWDLLQSHKDDKDWDVSWKLRYQIAVDVAKGMTYLHDYGILHRDLKSENILIRELREQGRAQIKDFE